MIIAFHDWISFFLYSYVSCSQDGFSVQFDDLFRKAWEDDVTEELGTDGELNIT